MPIVCYPLTDPPQTPTLGFATCGFSPVCVLLQFRSEIARGDFSVREGGVFKCVSVLNCCSSLSGFFLLVVFGSEVGNGSVHYHMNHV